MPSSQMICEKLPFFWKWHLDLIDIKYYNLFLLDSYVFFCKLCWCIFKQTTDVLICSKIISPVCWWPWNFFKGNKSAMMWHNITTVQAIMMSSVVCNDVVDMLMRHRTSLTSSANMSDRRKQKVCYWLEVLSATASFTCNVHCLLKLNCKPRHALYILFYWQLLPSLKSKINVNFIRIIFKNMFWF